MEEIPSYFNDILIFLLSTVVVVSIFRRFKASPIIGYMLAGVFIGPHALGFIHDIESSKFLGQMGVVFLLFSIGLKLTLERLRSMRLYVFGLGTLQVTVTSLAIGGLCYFIGLSVQASVLIGSALALSSTAVGLQVMTERGELAARFGRASFSILLLQDLAVVVLLVLVNTIGKDDVPLMNQLGWVAVKTGFVLALIIAMGRIVLRPVFRAIAKLGNPDLFVAMTLLVVLTTSLTTAAAGLSMELGAFLAGLLLSETEYRHQIQADIAPFHGLLLGLFFITVGMSIDLNLVYDHLIMLPAIILALVVGKFVLITISCRLFFLPLIPSLRTALILASGGEFAFVIFAPAMVNGMIPFEVGQLLYAAVAISMGLTPILDNLGKYLQNKFDEDEVQLTIGKAMSEIGDLKEHVIILGFGRVGKLVAKMMTERIIPFVAIDDDMERVNVGRSKGLPVFFGDATRPKVLEILGAQKAKVVVVCINSSTQSMKVAMDILKMYPNVKVSVRLRDEKYASKLIAAGADVIIPETLEPSLQLASSVLQGLGTSDEETNQLIDDFRRSLSEININAENNENSQPAA
ncbi:MAG: cation:proton antiporter [Alphaproteobacteria bacterium]|nr:cation:proton antiporter [Alphaproteobacteria bacterium]